MEGSGGGREGGLGKKTWGEGRGPEGELDTHVGGGGEDDGGAEVGGTEGPKEVAGVGHLVCVHEGWSGFGN